MGPPTGGPEDKTPPAIIATFPEPGATNVDTAVAVRITFSEPVLREAIRAAFGLSPPPPGTARSEWDGETVEITFDPPLLDDRTYALTLGTNLTDRHRNRLSDTWVLAFSTGDKLDTGHLTGVLLDGDKPLGWQVSGYFLDDTTLTTDPDPANRPPDATSQTGDGGTFQLSNLRQGMWRIFIFRDTDADRLWTPWSERIAVPPFDVRADSDTTVTPRSLLLRSYAPRVTPSVARATSTVRDRITVRFSPPPHRLDGRFALVLPPEGSEIPEEWIIVSSDTSTRIVSSGLSTDDTTAVRLVLNQPLIGTAIGLRVTGTFGGDELLDTTVLVDLSAAALRDTFPPAFVESRPPERGRLFAGRNLVELIFDEPVRPPLPGTITFIAGTDTSAPEVSQPTAARYSFAIDGGDEGTQIALQVKGEGVRDLAGNVLGDTTLTFRFPWLPEDSLGTISGTVVAPVLNAAVHLTFVPAGKGLQSLSLFLPGPGPFRLPNVPAGQWIARGWQDVSGTGEWFPGVPVPFAPADPLVVSADTIEVRARWETGAVRVIFP